MGKCSLGLRWKQCSWVYVWVRMVFMFLESRLLSLWGIDTTSPICQRVSVIAYHWPTMRVCDGANPSLKESWRKGTSLKDMSCVYMCFFDTVNDIRETDVIGSEGCLESQKRSFNLIYATYTELEVHMDYINYCLDWKSQKGREKFEKGRMSINWHTSLQLSQVWGINTAIA